MQGGQERVEWIPGVPGRWLYPLIGFIPGLVGFTMLWLGAGGILAPTDSLVETAIGALVSGSLVVIIVAVVRLHSPFNRRIGISRSSLFYDNGFRTFTFPWDLLDWANPTLLRARGGFWKSWGLRVNLTADQAARVREFQFTTLERKLELGSTISLYNPR